MASKPIIIVSNDDGITYKGLKTLVECIADLAEVIVVAPNKPQSAMGHSVTIHYPLMVTKSKQFPGIEAYECSGTPADCVKIAQSHLLGERTAAMVVSGINHGSNTALNILYSGTMAAAIEGAIEGLPAVGFSLGDFHADADFSHTTIHVEKIVLQVLNHGLPKGVALNVNFPKRQEQPIQGLRICRQANARWVDAFSERETPSGRPYLWLTGDFVNFDHGEDTDQWAVEHNYTSIVLCSFDLTAHHAISTLNTWNF